MCGMKVELMTMWTHGMQLEQEQLWKKEGELAAHGNLGRMGPVCGPGAPIGEQGYLL